MSTGCWQGYPGRLSHVLNLVVQSLQAVVLILALRGGATGNSRVDEGGENTIVVMEPLRGSSHPQPPSVSAPRTLNVSADASSVRSCNRVVLQVHWSPQSACLQLHNRRRRALLCSAIVPAPGHGCTGHESRTEASETCWDPHWPVLPEENRWNSHHDKTHT